MPSEKLEKLNHERYVAERKEPENEGAVEEAFPASLFETPVQEERFKQDAKRVR